MDGLGAGADGRASSVVAGVLGIVAVVLAAAVIGGVSWRVRKHLRARRTQAEIACEESQRLQQVIDALPDLVVLRDGEGTCLGCNAAYAATLGRTREEVVGRSAEDLLPPVRAARVRWEDAEVLSSGAPARSEAALRREDGSSVLMHVARSPLRDRRGAPAGVLTVARDITAVRQLEAELRDAQEVVRRIMQPRPAPVPPVRPEPRAPMPGALRILVAADEQVDRDLLQAALAAKGHRPQFARDALHAVELVQRHAYDLVLMDVRLPVLEGVEATRRIRALESPARGIPIMGLIADRPASAQEQCLAAGMNACLRKPIQWELLFAALARVAPAPAGGAPEDGDAALVDEGRLAALQGVAARDHLRQLLAAALEAALAARCRMSEAGDLLLVVAEARSLGESAATLGLARIAGTAGRIEQAARQGRHDAELLARLARHVDETRRVLAAKDLL